MNQLKDSKDMKSAKDTVTADLPDGKKTIMSTKSESIPKKNYLPELKKTWKHKSQLDEISSVLKNSTMDEATKKEYVKSMVDKLEENARRKEQLMRLKT